MQNPEKRAPPGVPFNFGSGCFAPTRTWLRMGDSGEMASTAAR
jgi:hypothetical protein